MRANTNTNANATPTSLGSGDAKSLAPAPLPCSLGIQFAVLEEGKWRMSKITAKMPTRQTSESARSSSTDGQRSPFHPNAGAAANSSMPPRVASNPSTTEGETRPSAVRSKPTNNNAVVISDEFIDIEPAIELEGDMAVEVTVEEQEGEGEGVDELTHDAPEVGGEAEATKGDRESVTIRGHSFNVNRPARRRSTTGVLGDSTDGAAPEDRVVVRERRSSVGDIL